MRKGDVKERLLTTLVDRPMPLLHDAYARIVELEAEVARLNTPLRKYYDGYNARIDVLTAALTDIRNKAHAHNRGGEMHAGLRDVIRDICDQVLAKESKR
jgi:hypothetical protein